MAYLRPMSTCRKCGRDATLELFNRVNASLGFFCKRHGNGALQVQDALESSLDADPRP